MWVKLINNKVPIEWELFIPSVKMAISGMVHEIVLPTQEIYWLLSDFVELLRHLWM